MVHTPAPETDRLIADAMDDFRAAVEDAQASVRERILDEYRRLSGDLAGIDAARNTAHFAQHGAMPPFQEEWWFELVSGTIEGPLRTLMITQAAADATRYKIGFDITSPALESAVEAQLAAVRLHSDAITKEVGDVLTDAIDAGWSVDTTASALHDLAAVSPTQATLIARTEEVAATNAATMVVGHAAGWTWKQWLATPDERTRPTHNAADGQTVPIDDPFDVGGYQGDQPGDPDFPPEERCNCRCTVVFLDDDEAAAAGLTAAASTLGPAAIEGAVMSPKPNIARAALDRIGRGASGAAVIEFDGNGTVAVDATGPIETWEGELTWEDTRTVDGRFIDKGALTFAPAGHAPLMGTDQTTWGHEGARVTGSIDDMKRKGLAIEGSGRYAQTPHAQEIAQLVDKGFLTGVSVDLDSVESEWIIDPEAEKPDDMDEWEWLWMAPMLQVVHAGRVGGATICPFPAFDDARVRNASKANAIDLSRLAILASGNAQGSLATRITLPMTIRREGSHLRMGTGTAPALLASGGLPASELPPAEYFAKRTYDRITPVVVEGHHVYGHIADWNRPHIVYSMGGQLIYPPRAADEYRNACNKRTPVKGGGHAWTCPITVNGGNHCKPDAALSGREVKQWYESYPAGADVSIYEDDFGIQIAGAIRPGASHSVIRELCSSDISPDWRNERGLGMVTYGLLSVGTSGFVVEATGTNDPTTGLALVASGGSHRGTARVSMADDQIVAAFGLGAVPRSPMARMEARLAWLESRAASEAASRAIARVRAKVRKG